MGRNKEQQKNNLAPKELWEDGYRDKELEPMPLEYPITKTIFKYFSNLVGKSVFEIGCYPGRLLYHFGKLEFELNGVDQTVQLPKLERWLRLNEFRVGQFHEKSLFDLSQKDYL